MVDLMNLKTLNIVSRKGKSVVDFICIHQDVKIYQKEMAHQNGSSNFIKQIMF